jgi:hypothetical protein
MLGRAAAEAGAGGDKGTNPAQKTRTAIVCHSFTALDNGNEINTTYLRLKFPMYKGRGDLQATILHSLGLDQRLICPAGNARVHHELVA